MNNAPLLVQNNHFKYMETVHMLPAENDNEDSFTSIDKEPKIDRRPISSVKTDKLSNVSRKYSREHNERLINFKTIKNSSNNELVYETNYFLDYDKRSGNISKVDKGNIFIYCAQYSKPEDQFSVLRSLVETKPSVDPVVQPILSQPALQSRITQNVPDFYRSSISDEHQSTVYYVQSPVEFSSQDGSRDVRIPEMNGTVYPEVRSSVGSQDVRIPKMNGTVYPEVRSSDSMMYPEAHYKRPSVTSMPDYNSPALTPQHLRLEYQSEIDPFETTYYQPASYQQVSFSKPQPPTQSFVIQQNNNNINPETTTRRISKPRHARKRSKQLRSQSIVTTISSMSIDSPNNLQYFSLNSGQLSAENQSNNSNADRYEKQSQPNNRYADSNRSANYDSSTKNILANRDPSNSRYYGSELSDKENSNQLGLRRELLSSRIKD